MDTNATGTIITNVSQNTVLFVLIGISILFNFILIYLLFKEHNRNNISEDRLQALNQKLSETPAMRKERPSYEDYLLNQNRNPAKQEWPKFVPAHPQRETPINRYKGSREQYMAVLQQQNNQENYSIGQERHEEPLSQSEGEFMPSQETTPKMTDSEGLGMSYKATSGSTLNRNIPGEIKCPACYSKRVSVSAVKSDGEGLKQDYICKHCGVQWTIKQSL